MVMLAVGRDLSNINTKATDNPIIRVVTIQLFTCHKARWEHYKCKFPIAFERIEKIVEFDIINNIL